MSRKKNNPGRLSHCCALLAAVLLTTTLTMTLLGAAVLHGLTSQELHIKAATAEKSLDAQMRHISEYIGELAEDYSFSAQEATNAVSTDELRELNRKMAIWWTRIVNDGVLDEMPEWAPGKMSIAVTRSLDEDRVPEDMTRDDVTAEVTRLIQERIGKITMPVRSALIRRGFQFLRRRVDPADAARFLKQGTIVSGIASLALAGMILLLTGKRARVSLRYFGAAMAGAGIACLFSGLLIRSAGIQTMIRDVSEVLAVQTAYILNTVTTQLIIGISILLAGGVFCLILDIRGTDARRGENNGKKTDHSQDSIDEDTGAAAAGGNG